MVLGVKLDELHHGMHVKVVQVLQGDAEAGDTLMVWGRQRRAVGCTWVPGRTATPCLGPTSRTSPAISSGTSNTHRTWRWSGLTTSRSGGTG